MCVYFAFYTKPSLLELRLNECFRLNTSYLKEIAQVRLQEEAKNVMWRL